MDINCLMDVGLEGRAVERRETSVSSCLVCEKCAQRLEFESGLEQCNCLRLYHVRCLSCIESFVVLVGVVLHMDFLCLFKAPCFLG